MSPPIKVVHVETPRPTTYSAAGVRIDDESGLPIVRVMKAIRPQVYESKAMEKAFEIGQEAHRQIERKIGNNGTEKEYVVWAYWPDFVLEAHLDLYNAKQGVVLEIKSWPYFVNEHQACVLQLSAYAALVDAKTAFFVLYQGDFQTTINSEKTKTERKFRVTSFSQAWVPLMPKDQILDYLEAKARELFTKLRAEGKLQ